MQFIPPQLGCSFNQNQNYFNPYLFQVPPPVQNSLNVTDLIVGEGDLFPYQQFDGTLQLFFVPRHFYSQNPRPCLCNRQPCYCNSWPYPGQVQAWFVRSIANSAAPSVPLLYNYLQLQEQRNNLKNIRTQHNQRNQFHRDATTSTTDLCLFFPCQRAASWVPKPCACIQATPVNLPQPNACCCNNRMAIEEKTRTSKAQKPKPKYNGSLEPNDMSSSSLREALFIDPVDRPGFSGVSYSKTTRQTCQCNDNSEMSD